MLFIPPHLGAPQKTRWRTLAVFAHTFSCSGRVVARAAAGRLTETSVDRVVQRWCDHVFRISRTSLSAEGLENVRDVGPCVLLSNHRSLLDIPAVCVTFPGRVRFVAKAELRRVPMFGRAMQEAGIVFVDRTDRAAAIASLQSAHSLSEVGTSLWIAAEGGRSRDGSLGPFKKGPFHVARDLGVPLVPVWIDGTDRVIEAGSLWSKTGQHVHVRFGKPLASDVERSELPGLMQRARAALLELA